MAAVKRGFKKKISYPQIRSAILSPSVYPLLAVCPNLESLTTFEESPFLLTFIKGLPALQKLSSRSPFTAAGSFSAILFGAGFNTPTAIAEELPSLQQISLSLVDSSGYRDDNYVGFPYFTEMWWMTVLDLTADKRSYQNHSAIPKPQNFDLSPPPYPQLAFRVEEDVDASLC